MFRTTGSESQVRFTKKINNYNRKKAQKNLRWWYNKRTEWGNRCLQFEQIPKLSFIKFIIQRHLRTSIESQNRPSVGGEGNKNLQNLVGLSFGNFPLTNTLSLHKLFIDRFWLILSFGHFPILKLKVFFFFFLLL